MATITESDPVLSEFGRLENGDRMTREEFHRAYEQAPKGFKAELIGGVVHVPSPLRRAHGRRHGHLGMLFSAYELNTPGTEAVDNGTVILGDESEPQPDLLLRVLPEFGGRTKTDRKDYIVGPPELVAEIAYSSRSIDLHAKRADYARNGVYEYLVMVVASQKLHWFDLMEDRETPPPGDGIVRVRSFPGFWINCPALFQPDYQQLMATLQQGLNSPEHGEFVRQLEAAKRTH
jgi:Uma2 family endonuclease